MKKITITIKTGNETMNSERDVYNALRVLADRIRQNGLENTTKVLDSNGNSVGTVEVE